MKPTTFENPMGIDGFEFVEFAAPDAEGRAALHELFTRMGFSPALRHKSRAITVYRQGGVNFLLNAEVTGFAAEFAAAHGPSACGFAIRFKKPVDEVLVAVKGNGGEALDREGAIEVPKIKGIGDCMLYLVPSGKDAYAADFAEKHGPCACSRRSSASRGL